MDSIGGFGSTPLFLHFENNHIYSITGDNEIIKYSLSLEELYITKATNMQFEHYSSSNAQVTNNNCLIAPISYWEESFFNLPYILVKLAPNGSWLHKLYIGGADYTMRRVYELANGNYLLTAYAYGIPEEYGSLFFMSIKKWDDGVGIKPIRIKEKLTSYPNPAKDILNIELPVNSNGILYITDIAGRVEKTEKINPNSNTYQLNIQNLNPGHYQIIFKSNYKQLNSCFIKH